MATVTATRSEHPETDFDGSRCGEAIEAEHSLVNFRRLWTTFWSLLVCICFRMIQYCCMFSYGFCFIDAQVGSWPSYDVM